MTTRDDAEPNHVGSTHNAARVQQTVDAATQPLLNPAPGRCIVRIVPRLLQAFTEGGIAVELDGRYENQPMLGSLHAIGDPTSERERVIAEWASKEANEGKLFVFSQYGAGSPYWNDEMRKMLPVGYDFTWLQGFRLFDIGQLATSVSGTGGFGERKQTNVIPRLVDLVAVQ